jgi:hypothetical protein
MTKREGRRRQSVAGTQSDSEAEGLAAAGTTPLCLPLVRGELKRGRQPYTENRIPTTNPASTGAALLLPEL